MSVTHHYTALPSGVTIHHLAVNNNVAPVVLLLHGFPTSSTQYRNLITKLGPKHRILAPDLPGFGLTTTPDALKWTYHNMAQAMVDWLKELQIHTFVPYVFDSPVFFRMMGINPNLKVRGLISQSGNIYEEGLDAAYWGARRVWWESNDPNHAEFRAGTLEMLKQPVKALYTIGVPADREDRLDPNAWLLDYYINVKDHENRLVDYVYDYGGNIKLYPAWQKWLREAHIPVLAVWGKNDPAFRSSGAEAFKRDAETEVHLLDGGHFLTETHVDEIAEIVAAWLERIKF